MLVRWINCNYEKKCNKLYRGWQRKGSAAVQHSKTVEVKFTKYPVPVEFLNLNSYKAI